MSGKIFLQLGVSVKNLCATIYRATRVVVQQGASVARHNLGKERESGKKFISVSSAQSNHFNYSFTNVTVRRRVGQ